ncbi:WXG100 family type VII secretion target [Streptomyces sp. NPDC056527]|uniref:WXG100 family type VII secretion target n=1 Tax=Streptomyces sp. NPDC056527 TaxID=3345853 RepID=UPI0036A84AF3
MSHADMLTWLDQASSFYVQDAADRLNTAAGKMREIARHLRDRPGRVEWKGKAEEAFLEWAESLASTTNSLADYSVHASTWMGRASEAIASAQSAMPRYTSQADAQANLDAARKYHNDPDSQSIARDARASMANVDDPKLTPEQKADLIQAKQEENRQAAILEMRKLSGAYELSGEQMDNFKVPTMPPPPDAFVPPDLHERDGYSRNVSTSTGNDSRSTVTSDTGTSTTRSQDGRPTPDVGVVPPTGDKTGPTHVVRPDVPVDLGIDHVNTLPPPTTTTPPPTGTPPIIGRPEPGLTPPLVVPPTLGTPPVTGGTGHTPPPGTRGPVGPTGRMGLANPSPLGGTGMPRDGISGGRQVSPTTGRPATGIPRSTVIGTEHGNGTGRMPMGGGGGHMGGTHPGGQNGISGGRRLAVETGGVVGARPQQPGATGARPFTPGGSGLVRGGGAQGGAGTGTGPMGRGGMVPAGTNGAGSRREDSNGERPDYLVEDEETWQQGGRRVAPPVID